MSKGRRKSLIAGIIIEAIALIVIIIASVMLGDVRSGVIRVMLMATCLCVTIAALVVKPKDSNR